MSPVAPEGYPFILIPALAGMFSWMFGYQVVAAVLWVIAVAFLAFYRNPSRVSTAPPDAILAPADGKVIVVDDAPAKFRDLGFDRQVSIFMSPADVHVNRSPISGVVRSATHSPGRKFPAYREKASELNEHSFVIIDGDGLSVAYKQIAGALARRVVCDLDAGDRVERGQRVGLIKLGSRVDIFLPSGPVIEVRPGERTRAGLTVIARRRGEV